MIINLDSNDQRVWVILPSNRTVEIDPSKNTATIRPRPENLVDVGKVETSQLLRFERLLTKLIAGDFDDVREATEGSEELVGILALLERILAATTTTTVAQGKRALRGSTGPLTAHPGKG